MRIFWAFLWRDILNQISYRLSFFLELLGIFPIVIMFFFLSEMIDSNIATPLRPYGGEYFPFVLIGIAMQNYLMVSLRGFSASLRESQLSGTIEAVLVTPVTIPMFLLGSTAYSFVFNSLRILIYLGIGSLLFGIQFNWSQGWMLATTMILTMVTFISLGIISASFILIFKKGDPINWGFNVISWLLGGVYYPITILPLWLQKAAAFIPMTHSLELLRTGLLNGHGTAAMAGHLFSLALWGGIALPLSLLCFRYALKHARVRGTLGHY
jgi:ABC-2 type transport system permease protein